MWKRQAARRGDERGAVMILATVGVVLAVVATALSVDIGRIAQERRRNQKVADMAALDAVRGIKKTPPIDPDDTARTTATANGFPVGYFVDAEAGTIAVDGTFTPVIDLGLATAVKVEVESPLSNEFAPGEHNVRARAVATLGNGRGCFYPDICEQTPGQTEASLTPIGSVRVGSSAATLTSDATILNRLLTATVGGTYSLGAVGWQGLANGNVQFSRLRTALGYSTGTPDGVLDANLKYRQLLNATVDALNADDESPSSLAAATYLAQIASQVSATAGTALTLRQLFEVEGNVGSGQDVADATVNVRDIVTGGMALADTDNFATFNLTAANIPGLPGNGVTVKFGLIEAPQTKTGPPMASDGSYRTIARTAQVKLLIELNLNVSLAAGLITLPIKVPYYLYSAGATASLATLGCASGSSVPTDVTIFGQTEIANAYVGFVGESALQTPGASVAANGQLGAVTVDLGVVLGSVGVTVNTTGALASSSIMGHSGSRTFTPDYTGATSQTIPGSTTVPLPTLSAANLNVELTGLGATLLSLGLSPSVVTNLVLAAVNPLLTPLNNTIVAPVTRGLGLSLGAGDLWAPPPQNCNPVSFNTDPTSSVGPASPFGYQIPSLAS